MKKMKRARVGKTPSTKDQLKLEVRKLVGAGNDFVFIDLRPQAQRRALRVLLKKNSRAWLAKKICRRQEGVGADGLVFVEPAAHHNFAWDFYNSDGSKAAMCGNAARCAVVFETDKLKKEILFVTQVGTVRGMRVSKSLAQVDLWLPKMKVKKTILVNGKNITGDFIDSGVPHFVIRSRWSFDHLPDRGLSRKIQKHKAFGAHQTNVTYVTGKGASFKTITFERGVCDFTKACGTGAIAAAYSKAGGKQKSVDLQTLGGKLTVKFFLGKNFCRLTGPVAQTFTGYVKKEQIS